MRYFHSPDAPELATFAPPDPLDFELLLQVLCGPADGPGEESFDVGVVTPAWLLRHAEERVAIIGRHRLIVARWDWSSLSKFIESYVQRCEGESWPGVAQKIGRLGSWEFED